MPLIDSLLRGICRFYDSTINAFTVFLKLYYIIGKTGTTNRFAHARGGILRGRIKTSENK